jgi:hypothetical protein
MKKHNAGKVAITITVLLIYFFLMMYFERTIFNVRPGRVKEEIDGFENSILYFMEADEAMPIWLTIRWILVYPFILLDGFNLSPFFQAIYLLLYSLPLAFWVPPGSRTKYFQLIIIFLPVFISFRMAITIFSIIYMYTLLVDKKHSMVLALLYLPVIFMSTSSMYIYMCVYFLLILNRYKNILFPIKAFTTIVFFVVIDQFYEKLNDLYLRVSGGELISAAETLDVGFGSDITGFILSLFTGNPLYITFINGRVLEFIFLIISLVLAIYLLINLYRSKLKMDAMMIIVISSSLLAEGLGAYALGIVGLIIFMHRNRGDVKVLNNKKFKINQIEKNAKYNYNYIKG